MHLGETVWRALGEPAPLTEVDFALDRIELERSKFKLARAQDLARMGSFDWRRGEPGEKGMGHLWLSPEALRAKGVDALTPKEQDYSAILTQLKAAGPEVVFFTGYYPEAGLLLKQKRQMGWNVPFIGGRSAAVVSAPLMSVPPSANLQAPITPFPES